MFIVIYKPNGAFNIDAKHYGPFYTYHAAVAYLESLPAIGINTTDDNNGYKYITALYSPNE